MRVSLAEGVGYMKVERRCCPTQGSDKFPKRPVRHHQWSPSWDWAQGRATAEGPGMWNICFLFLYCCPVAMPFSLERLKQIKMCKRNRVLSDHTLPQQLHLIASL